MCGIAGYLGSPSGPSPLVEEALLSAQRHRGPDEQGRLRFQARDGTPGQLVSTRLSIVDLGPEASQPMRSTDGRLSLSFNGEIYNHRALRQALLAEGAHFRSHSDTEVILLGYAHWGDRLWPRLRGMFALALWDAGHDELRLLRDPMGQKPLYVCSDGLPTPERSPGRSVTAGRLCFASEVRTLLLAGAIPRRIDPQALTGFLTWGSVPEPHCVVAGVRPLPAGHLLIVRVQAQRLQLDPPQAIEAPAVPDLVAQVGLPGDAVVKSREPQELVSAVRTVLADTIRCHLQGDVPVGILLSGGVDSTSVAAWARHVAPEQDLLAFTLTTQQPGSDAEAAQARATAHALGLQHQVVSVRSDDAARATPRWLAAQDQPTIDGGNTFLICEQVHRAGCKVVLSGAGGDELFLGYGLHHRFSAAWATYQALPVWLRSGLHGALPTDDEALAAWLYQRQRRLFPAWLVAGLLQPGLHSVPVPGPVLDHTGLAEPLPEQVLSHQVHAAGLVRVQAFEQQNYLRNTLLRDGDVLSMAHSVELRLPLCDPWLWRLLQALDPIFPTGQRSKSRLVAAAPMGDHCVAQAAQHQKRGFDLPLDDWLRGPLRSAVTQRFSDESQIVAAGLLPSRVRWLWALYLRLQSSPVMLRRRLAHRIWALYVWLAYVENQALCFD